MLNEWTGTSMRSEHIMQTNAQDSSNDELSLSDVFFTNEKKNHIIHVKLNKNGFILQSNKEKHVKISDIVGGRCIMRVNKSNSISTNCGCSSLSCSAATEKAHTACAREQELSAYFHVFSYILKPNLRNVMRRERNVLTLRFCSFDTFEENMQEAERWNKTLYMFKGLDQCRPLDLPLNNNRRILLFLNPKSGSGKARRLFHMYIAPVLNEADLLYDLYVTKHINYAKDFVKQRDLSAWCSIIAIGGDGLFFEILNGLLKRADWKRAIGSKLLGIIPCGSGNGLAKSLCYMYKEPYEPRPILGATLSIVRGRSALMDVVRLELRNQVLYSFLSVGWGLISDIDIESERLRSLGYQRFTLWSLHRLISLRTYRGKISYLIKKVSDDVSSMRFDSDENLAPKPTSASNVYQYKGNYCKSVECIPHLTKYDNVSLQTSLTRSFRSGLESWCSADSCESMYYSVAESVYHSIPSERDTHQDGISMLSSDTEASFGPTAINVSLQEPIPDKWIVEEGEFVMVQATYQTHLSTDCFFAPQSKLDDGTIYLTIIRAGISRSQLLNFLINMSSGTHIPIKKDAFVKVVAVTAFRIEPYEKTGIMTVDGERVEFGPIQGAIIPTIARVIVPN